MDSEWTANGQQMASGYAAILSPIWAILILFRPHRGSTLAYLAHLGPILVHPAHLALILRPTVYVMYFYECKYTPNNISYKRWLQAQKQKKSWQSGPQP